MSVPAKPFACAVPDCGKTFTNEDHLTVHGKKHDMELQLGLGHKPGAFPADQTPTPTRFIRNCEEMGLFQDLQNVNPFDEGFKRAMETKNGALISLDSAIAAATSDDALHTPHIFPNLVDAPEAGLYSGATKLTITRSASDESTVKHFGTVEAKLADEDIRKANHNENPSNGVITIRKSDYRTIVASNDPNLIKLIVKNSDKDLNVVRKDVMLTDTGKVPVMSQQSLDFAIDSLTSHVERKDESETPKNQALIDTMKRNMKSALSKKQSVAEEASAAKPEASKRGKKRRSSDIASVENENYEVMLKLPNGELVHLKSNDGHAKKVTDTKQKLKDAIESKLKIEMEHKIRSDIENQIKSDIQMGNLIIKVKDPNSINATVEPPVLADKQIVVKIAESSVAAKPTLCPKPMLCPVVIAPAHSFLIPVNKIAISRDKFAKRPEKKSPISRARTKQITPPVEQKTVHHRPECEILHKLGCDCNLNCAQDDRNKTPIVANEKVIEPDERNSAKRIVTEQVSENETSNSETDARLPIADVVEITPDEPKVGTADEDASFIIPDILQPNCSAITEASSSKSDVYMDKISNLEKATKLTMNLLKARDKEAAAKVATSRWNGVTLNPEMKEETLADRDDNFKKASRMEAVRRYRNKQKNKYASLMTQNNTLIEENEKFRSQLFSARKELAFLKRIFLNHCITCSSAARIRDTIYMRPSGNL